MMRRVVALAALAGCLAGQASAADPIEIAAIGPYSGGSAPMGLSMLNGIKLAVAEINRAGGVLGRRIVLIERNDMAKNETGARIAREVTEEHPVVAGVGLVNTGVSLAAAPYFEQARIPLIVSVSTGTLITAQFAPPEYAENYVFRMSATTALESAMIAAETERRGYRKVAIFADATSYGVVGRDDLVAALAHHRITPVTIEKFNIGATDMTEQLGRAQHAGADVILTYGIGPELAAIAKGRAMLGWDVPMMGSWTLSMSSFIDGAGPSAEGAIMPETFIVAARNERQKAFLAAYAATYGERILSPVSAAQGYDTIYVLAAAIRQAGSSEGWAIRQALDDLQEPVAGVVKTYRQPFNPVDHEAIKPADVVFGVVREGRVALLPPG